MCGIVCVLRKRDQQIEKQELGPLVSTIRHRGPDSEGVIVSGGLGLAMARLSIIDLRREGLSPYVCADPITKAPRAAIAFNGEIFNYIELREELQREGLEFQTTSDTEVLLKAYLQWGERCLAKLNGMFAFVIADFERNQLFIARDIAGEKPLYYCETAEELIIGSEIKAILARTQNPELHITDEFRAFEYTTGEETLFHNIFALLPGSQMTVAGLRGDFQSLQKKPYWQVESELIEVDPAKAVDMLDELLLDAVRIRLRSDVPLGLYLSGGIDSSLLACMADPQKVFSIHFDEGPKFDELRYAELVSRQIKAEHIVVRPTRDDFQNHLDDILYHLDQPVGSFSAFPLYMLAKTASQHVKIVLSGEGADELFSGYARYLLPMVEQRAYDVPELQNYTPLLDYYFGKPIDRFAHLLNRGQVGEDLVKAVLSPHFFRFSDLVHAMGYTEFKLMLVTLLHMEDRMASAFGIENRTPFLDKRIISFAFSLSSDLKIVGNTTKAIVREVAKRYIPREVLDRKEKLGLIAPINRWFNFAGIRGEFDRTAYNALCLERWREIFFVRRRFSMQGA